MTSTLQHVELLHAGGDNPNAERATIFITSVPPRMQSVNIKYSGDAAIIVYDPTTSFQMENCDISENQGIGLIVRNPLANVTIGSSSFTKNFPAGMHVTGGHTRSSLQITDSTFQQNSGAGLMLPDITLNMGMRQSRFRSNSHYGLYVLSTTSVNLVTDSCHFDDNGLDGLHARYLQISGGQSRSVLRNGGARGNVGRGFDLDIEYQDGVESQIISDQIILDNIDFASNGNGSVRIVVVNSDESRFPIIQLKDLVNQDNMATILEVGGTHSEVMIQGCEFVSNRCGSKSVIHIDGFDKTVSMTGNRFVRNVCRRVALFNTTCVFPDIYSVRVDQNTFESNMFEPESLAHVSEPLNEYCTVEIVGWGGEHTITQNSFLSGANCLELCSSNSSRPLDTAQISAENNWWGTTNINSIKEKIFDNNNWNSGSEVKFVPYLNSPSGSPVSMVVTETMTASSLGGRLNGTLRLTISDSPVTLTRDLTILPGSTLSVDAGVEIRVQARLGIFNFGKLQLDGLPSSPITFNVTSKTVPSRDVPLRLSGGSHPWEGTLEVLLSGQWIPVCYEQYIEFAAIACRDLGFGMYRSTTYDYTSYPTSLAIRCDGSENSLRECGLYLTNTCRRNRYSLKLTCYPTPGWGGIISLSDEPFDPQNINLYHVGYRHLQKASGLLIHGSSASNIMNNVAMEEFAGTPFGIECLDLQPSQRISLQKITLKNTNARDGFGIHINSLRSMSLLELEANIAMRVVSLETMCGGPTSLKLQKGQPRWIVNGFKKGSRLRCHRRVQAPAGYAIRVTVTETHFSYPPSKNVLSIYESLALDKTNEISSLNCYNEISRSEDEAVFTSNGSLITLFLQASAWQDAFFLAKIDVVTKGHRSDHQELQASLNIADFSARRFKHGMRVSSDMVNIGIDQISLSYCENGLYADVPGADEGHISVKSTVVMDNSEEGIYISSLLGSVTLSNVSVLDNSDHGIYISDISGTVNVSDVTSHSNSDDGIYLQDISGSAYLTNVITSGNGEYDAGIHIHHTDGQHGMYTIINATCQENNGKGIDIDVNSEAEVEIRTSLIQGNDGGGISANIEDAQSSHSSAIGLHSNEISNNKRYALHVEAKLSTCIFANNTISSNSCPYLPAVSFRGVTNVVNVTDNVVIGNNARETLSFLFENMPQGYNESNVHIVSNAFYDNFYDSSLTDGNFQYSQNPDKLSCSIEIGGYKHMYLFNYNMLNNPAMNYTICSRIFTATADDTIDARYNWWGSTVEAEIRDQIFDFDDWNDRAPVDYFPYLTGPDMSSPLPDPPSNDVTIPGTKYDPIIFELASAPVNQPQVRLMGGRYPWEGRVEVFYNEAWGTVCGRSYWSKEEADVVCRELGYGPSTLDRTYSFGEGSGPIWVGRYSSRPDCTGDEISIFNCLRDTPGNVDASCKHAYDVGIRCKRITTVSPRPGCKVRKWGGIRSKTTSIVNLSNLKLVQAGNLHGQSGATISIQETLGVTNISNIEISECEGNGIQVKGDGASIRLTNTMMSLRYMSYLDDSQIFGEVRIRNETGAAQATSKEELCIAPPWRLLVQPLLDTSQYIIENSMVTDTTGTAINVTATTNAIFDIQRNVFLHNQPHGDGNDQAVIGGVVVDAHISVRNNYIANNVMHCVFLDLTRQTDGNVTIIENHFFKNTANSTVMVTGDRYSATQQPILIGSNAFSSNDISVTESVVFLENVDGQLNNNVFFNNTAHNVMTWQGRTKTDSQQFCENNLFYDNIGLTPGEKYTLVVSGKHVQLHGNVLTNPANDAELATSDRTRYNLVDATLNWWGFNSSSDISSRVRDKDDNNDWAEARYDPWIQEEITDGPCGLGWTFNKGSSACYRFMGGSQSWDSAIQSCKAQYSILSRGFTGLEQDLIDSMLIARGVHFASDVPVWFNKQLMTVQTIAPTTDCVMDELASAGEAGRERTVRSLHAKTEMTAGSLVPVWGQMFADVGMDGRIVTVEDNSQREERKAPSWRADNEPVHTAQGSVAAANEFGFEVLPHPSYSAGPIQSDFYLFHNLKFRLRFDGNDAVIGKSMYNKLLQQIHFVQVLYECSWVRMVIDCEQYQCNPSLPTTTVESCLRCQDIKGCFKDLDQDHCKVWDEDRCSRGFIQPLYNDTSRIEKILISHNVEYVPLEGNILYRCPVRFSSWGATMFVNEGKLDIQIGKVLSSPQANGVLHKVEQVVKTDSYTVMVAHPATLEDMLDYSDFSQEVQLQMAVDMKRNEGVPELSVVERVLSGNGTLHGNTVRVITEDMSVYKCIGARATNEGEGSYHLLMTDIPQNLSVGDVIISNHSNGILEQVTQQTKTHLGVFIQTQLQDCFMYFNFREELQTTGGAHLPTPMPCSGGPDGADGLLVVDSAGNDVNLQSGDTVVGRKSGRLLANVEPIVSRSTMTMQSRRRQENVTVSTPLDLAIEDHFWNNENIAILSYSGATRESDNLISFKLKVKTTFSVEFPTSGESEDDAWMIPSLEQALDQIGQDGAFGYSITTSIESQAFLQASAQSCSTECPNSDRPQFVSTTSSLDYLKGALDVVVGNSEYYQEQIWRREQWMEHDSCPDCENGEEPEWNDCTCKCPQKTECGIPPTCVVGRMGPDCRQPDCRPCQDSCQSSCVCWPQWFGDCCELRRPRPFGGDPHLQTLDGKNYDFHGIGEFWDCKSVANDFGIQTRIIDGELRQLSVGEKYPLNNGSVHLLAQQPASNSTETGAVVIISITFASGASVSFDVRYSPKMSRQFINILFSPTATFKGNTEGLCGFMDDDIANDFTGPDGVVYDDAFTFAETWRVSKPHNGSGLMGSWSWNSSNFHPDDVMDFAYFNPNHRPATGIDGLTQEQKEKAEEMCIALGLTGTLLNECIFDVSITNDTTFTEQEIFKAGWSGEDCNIGNCTDCSEDHGTCEFGFCVCEPGWEGTSCNQQATCHGIRNCTSLVHGICVATDVCRCKPGYIGDDCSKVPTCSNVANCSGRGRCVDIDVCYCEWGWRGSSCATPDCPAVNQCSHHGDCIGPNIWFSGATCKNLDCTKRNDCSNHGICIEPNLCQCDRGYIGYDCANFSCEAMNYCSGYQGKDCSEETLQNEHPPMFQQDNYFAAVPENQPIGTTITTVHANDADDGRNGEVKYRLVQSSLENAESGRVSVRSALKSGTYLVKISASDLGSPPKRDEMDLRMIVTALSTNTAPQCPEDEIFEMTDNVTRGSTIGTVKVYDYDSGPNGDISYKFKSKAGELANIFSIDPSTGQIYIVTEVPHFNGTFSAVFMTVAARDNAVDSMFCEARIIAVIIPPEFSGTVPYLEFPTTTPLATSSKPETQPASVTEEITTFTSEETVTTGGLGTSNELVTSTEAWFNKPGYIAVICVGAAVVTTILILSFRYVTKQNHTPQRSKHIQRPAQLSTDQPKSIPLDKVSQKPKREWRQMFQNRVYDANA
ncbi:hypothetical protein Bbelb_415320 [Branchiostoma belcheri]|nr:hypothetical protein Bbelb_415320 [Branchiostoma belcheri]